MSESSILDFDCDLGWVEQGVVDEALMDGAFDSGAMLFRQVYGSFNFDAEIVDSRDRFFHFVGPYADVGAFGGELEFAEILRSVESGAGGERGEKEFGRSHAFVIASVLRWLIACDRVLTRFDFELNCAEMIDCHFHDGPPGFELPVDKLLRRRSGK